MQIEHSQAVALWSEADRLAAWRIERLEAAGFELSLAVTLAGRAGVDVHALIELVERGCPPALAARILAPLDDSLEVVGT